MSETTEAAPATEAADTPIPGAADAAQATEAPAAPAAPEPAESAPEEPKEPAKTAWWQKRIDELTRARHEAERKAERLEREAAGRQPQQTDPQQPPANLTDAQIEERATALAAQREYQKAVTRTIDSGNTKYGEAAFIASCNTLASLGANEQPAFMQAVTDLDHGADILHHLGANPELAARVMAMPPVRMAMELARLEGKITAPPPPKPVSKAPAPITPVEGGVSLSDDVDPDADGARWIAMRNKQEAERRGRR